MAILQHATAEKRAGDGMFLFFFNFKSSYLSFGFEIQVYFDDPSDTGMQNKLSKSKNLALEPME